MPLAAQPIIRRCVETLNDPTSIRWPVAELVRYLNDGQREVLVHRPDALVTNFEFTCIAGTRQTLPSNGAKLMNVVRNARSAGNKRPVTLVNREILDTVTASGTSWHALTGSDDVLHYMYDPRDPRTFYLYPPATTNTKLDIVYSAYPTDVTEPADGSLYTAVTGNISLPDIFGNVLHDYICFRAYTKDAEFADNGPRAQAHFASFATALGIERAQTVVVSPDQNVTYNPNARRVAAPAA